MKKILLISKVFSSNSPGRVEKFLFRMEYLSERGWKTIVVTPKEPGFCFDEESVNGFNIKPVIYMTPSFFSGFRTIYYKIFYGKKAKNNFEEGSSRRIWKKFFFGTLVEKMKKIGITIKSWIFIPDAWIGWFPFAFVKARGIIKKRDIDVIYSACYPFTSHLIALVFKKMFRKKWVAEFRDPWVNNPFIKRSKPWTLISSLLERAVVEKADKIVIYKGWFPGGRKYFYEKYSDNKDKVLELPYVGFDQDSFKGLKKTDESRLTITYAGNFYGRDCDPIIFIKALDNLLKKGKIPFNKIKVFFIGNLQESYRNFIKETEAKKVIKCFNMMPHKEAMGYLARSDVGLWIMGRKSDYNSNIPSKVFDYIGSRNYVLALVPEGSGADFIRENRIGLVADPSSTEDVELKVLDIYNLFNKKEFSLPIDNSKFNRKESEEGFRNVLEEVINCSK